MVALIETTSLVPFPSIASGKVRDLYAYPDDPAKLLFIATDRISAFDVNMSNGIPSKGAILTRLSLFWFDQLSSICRNHLSSAPLPAAIGDSETLKTRSLVVNKYEIFPIEAIVRGYITGSSWNEYKKEGTVHGIAMPEGMQESEAFPKPIYTPSTKADAGAHDENIHPSKVVGILDAKYPGKGAHYASEIERLALALYTKARDYALTKGIIIADTKFEFGLDMKTDEVVLVDEVLTPDSSRFWKKSEYAVGQGQDSYDKQYLRNWLIENKLKGKEGTEMPQGVVLMTKEKYEEAYSLLTGLTWSGGCSNR